MINWDEEMKNIERDKSKRIKFHPNYELFRRIKGHGQI
jgi:hypothetical protein